MFLRSVRFLQSHIEEGVWIIRFAAFFFWRYLISLAKQWTFWLFLFLDLVGVAFIFTSVQVNIPHGFYLGAAGACFLIANIEVIRKKEFSTLTKPAKEFSGHTFKINSLAFSSDGKLLVSASDRVAIIWETETGRKVQRVQCPTWLGNALFVDDDRSVIGIGGKGNFFRWDVETGDLILTQQLHPSDSTALALSSDRDRIATAAKEGIVYLWKYPEMGKLAELPMNDAEIRKVAFSPKKDELAACDVLGNVTCFNLSNNARTDIFKHPEMEPIRFVTYSPDGEKLAFVDGTGTIYCYNCRKKRMLPPCKGHTDMGQCCQFNPAGDILATGGQDNRIVLWKVRPNKLVKLFSIAGHSDSVISLAFKPGSNNLFSSSRDKKIKYWKLDFLLFSRFILGK